MTAYGNSLGCPPALLYLRTSEIKMLGRSAADKVMNLPIFTWRQNLIPVHIKGSWPYTPSEWRIHVLTADLDTHCDVCGNDDPISVPHK